jgi:predicted SnoaL-like aldol condensation-catalyzing enzyme
MFRIAASDQWRAAAAPGGASARQTNLVDDIFRLQNGRIVEHWNAIYVPGIGT